MIKLFTKARTLLIIFLLTLFVAFPAQTSRADAGCCASAVAEAAEAVAEMQAICSNAGGTSGACQLASANAAQLVATAANQCS